MNQYKKYCLYGENIVMIGKQISKKTVTIALIIVIILSVSIAFTFYVFIKTSDLKNNNQNLSEKLTMLEEENLVLSTYYSQMESEKQDLQEYLSLIQTYLNENNSEINKIRTETDQINTTFDTVLTEIDHLENGEKYQLHDPSYSEATSFISSDRTNLNNIVEGVYVCRHFARDVNNNAENRGIRCAYVKIDFTGSYEHACIGFQTTDQDMIYYDPIYDWKVDLEIGKDYFAECINCPPGYYFESNPNFVIQDFILIW